MGASLLLPLALAAAGCSASILRREPEPEPGFLSFPVLHEERTVSIARRDDDAVLYNHSTVAYMIQLNIGTPPQPVKVQLDTGSQELWVDPDCTQVQDTSSQQYCNSLGVYDPSKSSSFQDGELYTELAYGKGQVKIDYVLDNIIVPGSSSKVLSNVQFGVAVASQDAAVPICGISYGNGYNLQYNNLIDELAAQGVTNSKAFSLALGSSSQNNGGVVIFGGVDTKKFVGKLHQYTNLPPQANDEGNPWRYWIQLDSVGVTKPGSKSGNTYPNSGTPIVLDSGSTISYLPINVLDQLASDFGTQLQADGTIPVDCSARSQSGTVDFTFGQLTIHVPWSEFVWEESGSCIVGASPTLDGTTALLGDTFLRSAYVVFDQTNQQIFMAPYANCGSNEQSLPATAGAAANMTGECKSRGVTGPAANIWLAVAFFAGLQVVMSFL